MKRILVIVSIFILLGTISVSAAPTLVESNKFVTADSGTYVGEIGYFESRVWQKVGEMSGSYEQRSRFYRFDGIWEITEGRFAGKTGSMMGFFGRNILLGKITVTESGRSVRIVGFIGFNVTDQSFVGRFMSFVGPALYFKGSYR